MMVQHKYASTTAALMLAAGLRSAWEERALSLREIGRRLGYRQPVVLSHMASGRVPIPINRALAIAGEVGFAHDEFLKAVLHQHHPDVDWSLIGARDGEPLVPNLPRQLSPEQRHIVQEVVADPHPQERWLSEHEVPEVRLLRQLFPTMIESGLSENARDALRLASTLSQAEDNKVPDRGEADQVGDNER